MQYFDYYSSPLGILMVTAAPGILDLKGDFFVAACLSIWNRAQRIPDFSLERSAGGL